MPYLYRSERLAGLRKVHVMLWDNYIASYRTSGYLYERILSEIFGNSYQINLDQKYNELEKTLYQKDKGKWLDSELDRIGEKLNNAVSFIPVRVGTFFHIRYLRGLINGSPFTPFWNSLASYIANVDYAVDSSFYSFKQSPIRLLSTVPLLRDIFYVDSKKHAHLHPNILGNIIKTLLNPLKLLDDTLSFLHHFINRIFDVFLTKYEESPLPQMLLKGLVGGVITLLRLPLAILIPVVNLPYSLIENIFIKPFRHIYKKYSLDSSPLITDADVKPKPIFHVDMKSIHKPSLMYLRENLFGPANKDKPDEEKKEVVAVALQRAYRHRHG